MKKLLLLSALFFFACSSDEEKQIITVNGENYNSENVTKEDPRVADVWDNGTMFIMNNTSKNLTLESVKYKPKLSLANLSASVYNKMNDNNNINIDYYNYDMQKEAKRSYFLNDEIDISPGLNAINVNVDYLFSAPPEVKMVDEEEVNWYLHR